MSSRLVAPHPLPSQPVHDHMQVVHRAGGEGDGMHRCRRSLERNEVERKGRGGRREGGYGEVINKDLGTGIPCADGFN